MPRAKARDRVSTELKPLSVTPVVAARMLGIHYETIRDLLARDVFTVLAPKGRGVGKRVFIPTDEVELYARTRDEAAVQQFRKGK